MRLFILEDDPFRIDLFRKACYTMDVTYAESYEEAVRVFSGPYDVLCLDHDLGGEQMVPSAFENTGYTFCKWLPVDAHNTTVYVHSYNPDGAENMMQELRTKAYNAIRLPFGLTILNLLKQKYGTHTY